MVRLHEEESDADLSEVVHLVGAIGEDPDRAALLAGRPSDLVDSLEYSWIVGSRGTQSPPLCRSPNSRRTGSLARRLPVVVRP